MKMRLALAGGLLALSALAAAKNTIYTYPRAESLPEDSTAVFPRDPALLTRFDTHMTGARFFAAWSNRQNERERIKADMYFAGVLDATEGSQWCADRPIKPGVLHEWTYGYFAKVSPDRLKKERAAALIVEAVKKVANCH